MALIRFTLDLAIPEAVYQVIPSATKIEFRDRVRAMKALAVKINEGSPNEEMTVKATWHRCTHDEDPASPCVEQEV